MSLFDIEHFADKMTCTVECCECDKVDTIEVLESTTIAELEGHLCENCTEPLTFEKFFNLLQQCHRGIIDDVFVAQRLYRELLATVMCIGTKYTTVYDYIKNLNLNDKTRGI